MLFPYFYCDRINLENFAFSYFSNRSLQEHYMCYPELRPETKDDIDRKTAAFESEIEVLEKKLFLEEIALDVTDERSDFLAKNLR